MNFSFSCSREVILGILALYTHTEQDIIKSFQRLTLSQRQGFVVVLLMLIYGLTPQFPL